MWQGRLAGWGAGSAVGAPLPGGSSLGNKNTGQSWGLVSTQRGFLPFSALQGQEAGKGESPDSEYLRGLRLNFQAG